MEQHFPIQFPLIVTHPILLYQEQTEGCGKWQTLKYIEFQIPTKWDIMGETIAHRSKFIFNRDIENLISSRSSNISNMQQNISFQRQSKRENHTWNQIETQQQQLFMLADYHQRSEVLLTYSTDVHYCNSFAYLAKKPYEISKPSNVNLNDYIIIFLKRQNEKSGMTVDVIGFSKHETNVDLIIAYLLQQIIYEARYSIEGIKQQVEASVDRIFQLVLKQVLRYIGKVLLIYEYNGLRELAYEILIARRSEFVVQFSIQKPNKHFCKNIKILKRDIMSMVYKTMISEGLFPIHCEINTMNDSYLKLKLLSLVTDSQVLPWSAKFHASLAIGDQHYSFTPNDLFNLRTLKDRKYNIKYDYIRIRVLDFFPLNSWVERIGELFVDNLAEILNYISDHISSEIRVPSSSEDEELLKMRAKTIWINPGLQEPLLKKQSLDSSNRSISIQYRIDPPIETELSVDQLRSRTNLSQQQKTLVISRLSHQPLLSKIQTQQLQKGFVDQQVQQDPGEDKKHRQFMFKKLLRRSLQRITENTKLLDYNTKLLDQSMQTPLINHIKSSIAEEFYISYQYELQFTGILNKFCAIITETELRSYSTLYNNCQTPVAAFIYQLCDTFRPYSEALYPKFNFFHMGSEELNRESMMSYHLSFLTHITIDQLPITGLNRSLQNYLKFGSTCNLIMIGENTVQPADMDQSLDYFGFYGDKFSNEYLKKIQVLDPKTFDESPPDQQFSSSNQKRDPLAKLAIGEDASFTASVFQAQDQFFKNYEQIMRIYEQMMVDEISIISEIESIIEVKQPGDIQLNSLKTNGRSYHLHNLMLNQQNKVIKLKQNKEDMASSRHRQNELLQEACFLYYNSIRIQLQTKQRKNTLSYIGFTLAKDLDQLFRTIPQNVTIQTLD